MERIKGNYGWTQDVYSQARAVVNCLGGGEVAYALILETATAETGLGKITDGTVYAGMGLCQFDKIPFYRIRDVSMKFRDKIKSELKVDIKLIKWEELRYNPFLSLLFCRLYYLAVRSPNPTTLDGRAKYWKKYYNSYLGKGTPEHYIKMVSKYLDIENNPYVINAGVVSENKENISSTIKDNDRVPITKEP